MFQELILLYCQIQGILINVFKSIVQTVFRIEIYKKGGVINVTSRILIVDLLAKRVPINHITGFLVLDAHE